MPFGCFVRYFFLNFPLSNSLGPCERWKRGKGSTIRVSWKSELCTHTLTHIHWYLCQCSSNVSLLSLYASSWCRFYNTCKQTYGAELQKESVAQSFFLSWWLSFPLFWLGSVVMKILPSGCNISFNFKNQEHILFQTCDLTSNPPHHRGCSSSLNSQLSLAACCGLPCLGVVDGLLAAEPQCCLANVLGALNTQDFNAVAGFPKSIDLAME